MSNNSIGRNDKCPCESGKKYKYCCMNNDNYFNEIINDDYIENIKDYGNPKIDKLFFSNNKLDEKINAPRLCYSKLFHPELEIIASSVISKDLNRNSHEKRKIENTDNINELIDIMKSNPDILYHISLKDKILKQKEIAVPLILKELNNQINDVFLELAVSIIYFSKIECSADLINIIRSTKRAYAISLLCMLLGFFENNLSEKLLWDCFHFFKEMYPNKSYSQGPLLGLIELFNKKLGHEIDAIL